MAKKRGLGRGLDALLGAAPEITVEKSDLMKVPLAQLEPGKYQPRRHMDETELNELAHSIREQGVLQPILVRRAGLRGGQTRYEIIAGERRYRAALLAGLEEIPAIIKDVADQSVAIMALIENIQRENLNPFEEAQGINRLIADFGFTHEDAANALGRQRSTVTNLLRLLNLTKPVQTMLMAGDIDMGHARALLATDGATQIKLATEIVAKKLSVRDTEKLVSKEISERNPLDRKKTRSKSADVLRLEEELSDTLATRVSFHMNAKGRGQLRIDFSDLDVLDGILQKIRPSH